MYPTVFVLQFSLIVFMSNTNKCLHLSFYVWYPQGPNVLSMHKYLYIVHWSYDIL